MENSISPTKPPRQYKSAPAKSEPGKPQSPIEGVRHVSEVLPNVLSQIVEWYQQRKDEAA